MDNSIIIVLIAAIALLLVFFIVVSASRNKEKKRTPNYRALFVLGITFLPIGIATENPGMWGLGAVFMIIGAANKDKWGKETKWADLPPETKKMKIIIVTGLTILLLGLILFFMFFKRN